MTGAPGAQEATCVIIDSGLGNIQSVKNMVSRVGYSATVSRSVDDLDVADKIILPGVGSFDAGMRALRDHRLVEPIRAAMGRGADILGICLGMQLLFDHSEEGELGGLSLIPGRVTRFNVTDPGVKIPHMGWNVVRPVRPSRLLIAGDGEQRFYHVHSYHVECTDPSDVAAVTNHGYDFPSIVERGNVFGVQFHPEKSHRFGMVVIKSFLEL